MERWRARARLLVPRRLGMPVGLSDQKVSLTLAELRTVDPTIAEDIYSGWVVLADKSVETGGRSPFHIHPPSIDWARELHGFSWLRHMRGADSSIAQANARSLISDWMTGKGPDLNVRWSPQITARRLLSWLSQANFLLDGADPNFTRNFIKFIHLHQRRLDSWYTHAPDGEARMLIAVACCAVALCVENLRFTLKNATAQLDAELKRQILKDGGHVSRSPEILISLLLDLLPLRQAYGSLNAPMPQHLASAIDRMLPMLRFFRHRDGRMAGFNGMSQTPIDLVAAVLAFDEARIAPEENAEWSGYQRVERDELIVLMDTGPSPPLTVSGSAHAGYLSFEMSHGSQRIIVNCGHPKHADSETLQAARATAAHSTITLADTSAAKFTPEAHPEVYTGLPIVEAPETVRVARKRSGDTTMIAAHHDGYQRQFGVVHKRTISVPEHGGLLSGQDHLHLTRRIKSPGVEFASRFHLHPRVSATLMQDGATVLLTLPNGEAFEFVINSPWSPQLEESIFFSGSFGPRPTTQIVLYGQLTQDEKIDWAIQPIQVETAIRMAQEAAPRDQ